jgi:hypothetical protein
MEEKSFIYLIPYKEGMIGLFGPGVNILRSKMTPDDKAFFGIKNDGGVFVLDEKLVFKFQDLCARLNIIAEWAPIAGNPTGNPSPQGSTLPRAVIPPWNPPMEQPAPAKSTDPILFEAKMVEPKGKTPYMKIKWLGIERSCFDKGLWPILTAAIGKPVMLEVKSNGKWSNLVRILRVDGVDFEQPILK